MYVKAFACDDPVTVFFVFVEEIIDEASHAVYAVVSMIPGIANDALMCDNVVAVVVGLFIFAWRKAFASIVFTDQ